MLVLLVMRFTCNNRVVFLKYEKLQRSNLQNACLRFLSCIVIPWRQHGNRSPSTVSKLQTKRSRSI